MAVGGIAQRQEISIPGSGGLEERDTLSVLGRDALDDDMRGTLQS